MNKYIKTFDTDADYQSFISGEFDKPNLSYVKATNEVHYNKKPDYSKEYLTFEALESGTFTLTVPAAVDSTYMTSVSYSTDNGANWVDTTIDNTNQTITTPTIAQGDKVLWKGEGTTTCKTGTNSSFSSTGDFNMSGNIMSLLYGDNFANQTAFPSGSQFSFYSLFSRLTELKNAENLILPATTLVTNCYQGMFQGCSSLTTAPSLNATTLANYCYSSMFKNCTSLTTAPELHATTLTTYCYADMFQGCSSLTTAPSSLPATTLTTCCYYQMFYNCSALTTGPTILATTLVDKGLYDSGGVCQEMFKNCTSLTTAPELHATTLTTYCYAAMFSGCRNLNSITMLATDISAIACLNIWLYNVASSGTFTKDASMTTLPTGDSGIPSGWTVVNI